MSKIVVCKRYRLLESKEGKYAVSGMKKEQRTNMKLDALYVEQQNKIASMTGIYFEVDEKATKEREQAIESLLNDGEETEEKATKRGRKPKDDESK